MTGAATRPALQPAPAWHQPRLHQQAILALLTPAGDGRRQHRLTQLGDAVRRAFADLPLPLIALQSDFSRLEGTASVEEWQYFLSALHDVHAGDQRPLPADRRGGNFPAGAEAVYSVTELVARIHAQGFHALPPVPPRAEEPSAANAWAVLADRDDCCGLPRALEKWGVGHVGLGATIAMPGGDVVLLAPDEIARRTLCRLLSARLDGDAAESAHGLIALVRNIADGNYFHTAGAEVWWRAASFPEVRPVPFPIACVPLLRHLNDSDRRTAALRDAIRRGGTLDPDFIAGLAAADLLDLPRRYAGHTDQLAAGAALRERLCWRPERTWIMPHLVGEFAGRDADLELQRLAEAGLPRRYGDAVPAATRERLTSELAVIRQKKFAAYLLTVWLLTRDRTTCGRGSGASSLVCYLLEITNVDPIAAHLRFDRFLAPDRTDPPDLDVDFPWDERDAVFAAVFERFGSEHVAMVATHQRLKEDGALRETAKAHGLPGGGDPEDPRWADICAAAAAITGAPRHLGLHCGGIVVTAQPIREIVPVHRAAKRIAEHADTAAGVPTIAWEKDGAEYIRLVKIDLLGNRSLAVIRDALADLRQDGIAIDPATWDPTTDALTKELVARGDTMGCFYIESPATRQLQAKVASGEFDRLVVHSSMIRPAGSMFIDAYIQRHRLFVAHGNHIPPEHETTWFPHPALRNLLSETYGVFAYQEDIMGAAEVLAGFTSKQSNALRKALGRNDTATTMPQLALAFAQGCRAQQVSDSVAAEVWRMIASFAGYSFCKAHSASYAMVSFQCAWLKAHHPAYFLARVIANEGGFYAASAYVEEARRLGVRILAPCVQRSSWSTQREDRSGIRLGFHLVRGMSQITVAAIERERPFVSVSDLLRRTPCASDELTALREAGALDALTPDLDDARRSWLVALLIRRPPARRRRAKDCIDFGDADTDVHAARDPVPPPLPVMDARTRELRRRDRLGGVMVPCHLLSLLAIPRRPRGRAREVTAVNQGQRIDLVAVAITDKGVQARTHSDKSSSNNSPMHTIDPDPPEAPQFRDMGFVTLEDETGLAEATWFPAAWAAHAHLLRSGRPLRVRGRVEVAFGVASLTVDAVTLV